MKKTAGNMSMSFGAIGGLLMFPAIPGYFPLVILPIFLFFIAYKSYTLDKCKHTFIIVAAFNFIIGNGLYFAPHADNDGLNGYGLLVVVVVTVVSMIALVYIIRLEEAVDESEGKS